MPTPAPIAQAARPGNCTPQSNDELSANAKAHWCANFTRPSRVNPTPIRAGLRRPWRGPHDKTYQRRNGGYNPPGIAREYHTVIAKNIRDGS
nr:MAG TPA: hypothetical protein [Caudoviricetes sp.]